MTRSCSPRRAASVFAGDNLRDDNLSNHVGGRCPQRGGFISPRRNPFVDRNRGFEVATTKTATWNSFAFWADREQPSADGDVTMPDIGALTSRRYYARHRDNGAVTSRGFKSAAKSTPRNIDFHRLEIFRMNQARALRIRGESRRLAAPNRPCRGIR